MSALGVHFRFVARCWNPSLLACRLLVVALVANGKGVKPLHLNRIGRVRMFGLLSQLWPALPEVDVLPVGAWAAPGGFTTNPGPLNVAGGGRSASWIFLCPCLSTRTAKPTAEVDERHPIGPIIVPWAALATQLDF